MNAERNDSGIIELRYRLARAVFSLDVEADLAMRGITGIFGRSGAGKTSLLRCIAGLESPDEGRLVVGGDVWQDSKRGIDRPVHARDIGYVFQEPRLFPHLDVRGNLEYARRRAAGKPARFDDIVAMLGLAPLMSRAVSGLSGGEAQRVAIGRALLRSPRLVLMDEPLAALDEDRKNELLPYLDSLHNTLDIPALYVSHNIGEICRLCDQLLVMDAGRAVAHGALRDVLMQTDLPVLGGDEAGSVVEASVVAYDELYDLARVRVSGGELHVAGRFEQGAVLRLRLRANDVSLAREPASATSILNTLPATIEAIDEERGATALVHLVAGRDRLLSRVTRRSVAELGLRAGEQVVAQVKSVSVRCS